MRITGRYNLASLGWKSFEDLCRHILRVVLGETVVGFGAGGDGGRDSFYTGTPTGKLKLQFGGAPTILLQFKHTSEKAGSLTPSLVSPEIPKLTALAASKLVTYVLMTNRRLTADSESEIRKAVLAVPGVQNLLILNEQWIEYTIDAEPRLLRLVPRLYGVGDLTQILAFPLERQSRALLDALLPSLATFVPTDSYRSAERLLTERGMVVLVGPPASGKSTIAANLCAIWAAQTEGLRAFKLDKAEHFVQAWSPDDPKSIYWVDDIFGETTLDGDLLRDWSRCLSRIEAAVRKGAMVVVGTRDYILKAAEDRLKVERAQILRDASIQVRVDNLTSAERRRILYNHVKHGDLPTETKARLKPLLPRASELPSFTPELARRLGCARFHRGLTYDRDGLRNYFDNPVEFFTDAMAALAPAELAALTACLLHNNTLPDPVPDALVPAPLKQAYGVEVGDVHRALERLEGTFSRRQPGPTGSTWRLHHPSMTEALQTRLRSSSAYFELYIRGAELKALLRDTSTVGGERLVLVPAALYGLLAERLVAAPASSDVARYLADRGSEAFLRFLDSTAGAKLDALLVTGADPDEPDEGVRLARRLHALGLLTATRTESLWAVATKSFRYNGAFGFLDEEGVVEVFGVERVRLFVSAERDGGYRGLERLFDWLTQDSASFDNAAAGEGLEILERYQRATARAYRALGMVDDEEVERLFELEDMVKQTASLLLDRASEGELNKSRREDYDYEYYEEQWREERYELEHGLFSDVDE